MGEWHRSAAYRIAFATSAAFALTILILGTAVYLLAHAGFQRQQDVAIANETADLLRVAQAGGVRALARTITSREAEGATNTYGYALFNGRGERVAGAFDAPRPQSGWQALTFVDPREGLDRARGLGTSLPGNALLVVAQDGEPLERVDSTILSLFGGALVALLLLSLAGALALGTYLRRRLDRIERTALAISGGDLTSRALVSGREDEFDRVALALNAMLDQVAVLLTNLRQVSADIAHDLRTPLTRLRRALETALEDPGDAERQRGILEDALAQSDRLLALFASILRISEVEAGQLRQGFRRVDAGALVRELCDSFAAPVVDEGRQLECEAADGLIVEGDRALLTQALVNLIDNAQRHTPAGTHIALTAVASDADVLLSVADDGHGVAPADRERITRRFVRLDPSRTREGHGLGLALVEAVAELHGGRVEIGDNHPGLCVTLHLPAAAA